MEMETLNQANLLAHKIREINAEIEDVKNFSWQGPRSMSDPLGQRYVLSESIIEQFKKQSLEDLNAKRSSFERQLRDL